MSHIGVAFIEGFPGFRVGREKEKILGDIEEGRSGKGNDEGREDRDTESMAGPRGFFDQPEHRNGCEEEDRDLGTDRAERVGQAFIGEEFGCQHGEERSEEEEIDDEAEISVGEAQAPVEEVEGLPEQDEESGEEEGADDWIKYRIGRVVVAPVLIPEEIVFDERDRKSLGHGSPKIALVNFRRKHGDMR